MRLYVLENAKLWNIITIWNILIKLFKLFCVTPPYMNRLSAKSTFMVIDMKSMCKHIIKVGDEQNKKCKKNGWKVGLCKFQLNSKMCVHQSLPRKVYPPTNTSSLLVIVLECFPVSSSAMSLGSWDSNFSQDWQTLAQIYLSKITNLSLFVLEIFNGS